jgi:hypothetical protein
MAEIPYSLEEFWDIVRALADDVRNCSGALEMLDRQGPEDQSTGPFWRKTCAYCIFALIEGATYHLLYIAYVARHTRGVVFTLEELEALENAYDFDEEKRIEPGIEHKDIEPGLTPTQMIGRIKFAFNAFARVHGSDYIMPNDGNGWAGIRLALQVKSEISRPRFVSELEVSDDTVTSMLLGTPWFMQCLTALLQDCRDCAERRLAAWDAEDNNEPIM